MRGLQYQLKNIRRDKMCILTFLLPVIVGAAINMLSDASFSSMGITEFGIVRDELPSEAERWLTKNGYVTVYESKSKLVDAVNDPATQLIGVQYVNGSIQTMVSGDEFRIYKTIGGLLPELYNRRAEVSEAIIDIQQEEGSSGLLKSLLIVITVVTALFMGCTYNAMLVISEKEDGISLINQVLPMTKQQFMLQKISLGLTGSVLSAIITAMICIRIEAIYILPLLLFILLSAIISALTGLFIGGLSNSLMTGIAYIKVTMILFIAPPILCYLIVPAGSAVRTLSYLLPSSAVFYGLMELMGGQAENIGLYLIILVLHCTALSLLYIRWQKVLS